MAEPLLDIRDLGVRFATAQGEVTVLDGVSLAMAKGEILSVVGESGAGKTTLGLAILRLLAPNARISGGSVRIGGDDLVTAPEARLRRLRGSTVSMVSQSPRAALNPVRRIGDGIVDTLRAHRSMSRAEAREQAVALLERVRLPDPARLVDAHPHELSGGMCQRAMIAMAIACEPKLLIADEPTTALDTTTEAAVLALLEELVRERGMGLMLITHDLGLAARHSDRIAVMEAGRLVESGPPGTLFGRPEAPGTRRLVAATPRVGLRVEDLAADALPPRRPAETGQDRPALLKVSRLTKSFGSVAAVEEVSFAVRRGESVGLVGESGSGKSTVARLVSRLIDPDGGGIAFDGCDIGSIAAAHFHRAPERRRIQLVFQDPFDSLNPRTTAFAAIADPLRRLAGLRGEALDVKVRALAAQVRLAPALLERRPHRLSGGERTRVGIARAIALDPDLLVLDEPTTALDVSVQAAILTLVERLRRELGLSILFISHDLAVVRMMCDRILVMRDGRIVEEGESEALFRAPQEAYTRALVDAMPVIAGLGGER